MEVVQTANPPSFETVWAILDRVSKKQEALVESQKETDRIVKDVGRKQEEYAENLKETERVLKEQSKSINDKIGSLTNLFGDVN